jgi:hypothetical protein
MKKMFTLLGVLVVFASSTSLSQVLYNNANDTYTQDFNLLGTNASSVWGNNSTLPGWYALGPATNPVVIASQTGSSTSGTLANFSSTATNTNRSLGWVLATSIGATDTFASIGFGISNATGLALDSFSLGYTGRQWRGYPSNGPVLSFQYKIGGAFDNTPTNAITGGSWVDVGSLDFVLPVTNVLAVNGLVAPNFTGISNTVTGVSWSEGDVLWVRWRQQNLSGIDAQMAIDDVSFSAVPEPSTYALLALAGTALVGYAACRRRR